MSVTFFATPDRPGAEVNMSNHNASAVLEALGLPTGELMGETSGHEMLERALTALWADPQQGTPDVVEGNVITLGRDAGYMQRRLTALVELARGADRVHWA